MAEEEREGCNDNKKPLLTEQVVKQVITTGDHFDETHEEQNKRKCSLYQPQRTANSQEVIQFLECNTIVRTFRRSQKLLIPLPCH